MNISAFNQAKELERSFEGEAVRLSNELRAKPASFYLSIGSNPQRIDTPAKQGFDVETADFMTMVDYLADSRIKKSQSIIAFIHRVMSVRFPNEYTQNKQNIDNRYKLEMEMIESKSKNDVEWLGEVGTQNNVRLDGSLTMSNTKTEKIRNGTFRSVRII